MQAKTKSASYNCFTESNWIIPRLIPPMVKGRGFLGVPGLNLSIREKSRWSPRSWARSGLCYISCTGASSTATGNSTSCATLVYLGQTLISGSFFKKTSKRKSAPCLQHTMEMQWEALHQTKRAGSTRKFWIAGWKLGMAGPKIRANKYILMTHLLNLGQKQKTTTKNQPLCDSFYKP